MKRVKTVECVSHIDQQVTVKGWIKTIRKLSKVAFIDLRDRYGVLQIVVENKQLDEASLAVLEQIKTEYVVAITGTVLKRPDNMINTELATGEIEMLASHIEILNETTFLPFEVEAHGKEITEEIRLKYRYLDLRTQRMQNNMKARHEIIAHVRQYLYKQDFYEIETPCLGKDTPEGAREFIVPSRKEPGNFYVLPQSPQQYKQLLMVSGFEKYFQVARCFRDEDTRKDRQSEFTQLDLEMSFATQEEIIQFNEAMLIHLVKTLYPEKRIQTIPFPRLTYQEAMSQYQTDRPDIREDKNDPHLLAFCWVLDFPFFEKTPEGNWTFTHNPFSAAKEEYAQDLREKKNIDRILTTQYDIVLNGFEIGGGSIRNHKPQDLKAVLEIIGYDETQIIQNFGHMLEAFTCGAPPHGGIAWGLDRLVAVLQNEEHIRDVIAFPKTGEGKDLMLNAPSPLDEKKIKELGLQVIKKT